MCEGGEAAAQQAYAACRSGSGVERGVRLHRRLLKWLNRSQCAMELHGEQEVKPYDIEVQRLKSMKHDKGLIEVSVDALVIARKLREDEAGSTYLRIPVDHARTLMLLLKQQFAALDKLQPRSRRSGRA
jgi:hypothetical protein